MKPLLDSVQLMTRGRDRTKIELALAEALFGLTHAKQVNIYKLEESASKSRIWVSVTVNGAGGQLHDDGISAPEELLALSDFPIFVASHANRQTNALGEQVVAPILTNGGRCYGFVEIIGGAPDAVQTRPVTALLAIFTDLLSLLDYSEIDTLTGLLNRKTFDEYLGRILSSLFEGDHKRKTIAGTPRRRRAPAEHDHWLGVVDIDHFKQVNDTFGHSIGDEVLLLIANMMKECFRAHDKLFRFGGEEFVVLLKPTTEKEALGAFQRFLKVVEKRRFPLVGHITVSTGFARIGRSDQPSLIFDRADQALYWVKCNGRNQACNYEVLIASGALKEKDDKTDIEFF